MSLSEQRICNFCKRSDVTDFSTCRFCGEKYGATPKAPPKTYLTEKALAVSAAAVVCIGVVHQERVKATQRHDVAIASVAREIKASHRPRVLEFYADWCGPCKSYGPVIEAARAKYPGVDFFRYNIDDDDSLKLRSGFAVRAIPATFFFDASGREVDDEVGALDIDRLDEKIKQIL
ncbi:MAG TPA: thioredoxin family protein [Drouetiella sp.]